MHNLFKSQNQELMLKKILDSCMIIDWAESDTLNDHFQEMFKQGIIIYIPGLVLSEITNKLEEKPRIQFTELYNEGLSKKLIIHAHKKYRLRKEFKNLTNRLSSSKKYHLSRTDIFLIAFAAQLGASIITSDSGINDAIKKLKFSKNPWQKYFANY